MAEAPTPRDPVEATKSDAAEPRVRAQRIDPTLPHIKRHELLGIREVPAKQQGPGQPNNLNTGRNLTERKPR